MALFCLGSVRQQIFSRNNFAKAISQLVSTTLISDHIKQSLIVHCFIFFYISFQGMISASQTERGMSSNFLDHYAKVPSLPAPNLQQTLSTYLKLVELPHWNLEETIFSNFSTLLPRTVKPHVNDEEFAATESHAEQFAQGIGEKLHRMLQQKAANESNWVMLL